MQRDAAVCPACGGEIGLLSAAVSAWVVCPVCRHEFDFRQGSTVKFDDPTPSAYGEPPAEPPGAPSPLDTVGDYELLERIGRGGMGVVYKARQRSLNRTIALKMLHAVDDADGEDIQRFRTEAEAAGQLDHPHIVPVLDSGEHGGRYWYSMGYVDGPSLSEEVRGGPLSPQQAAEIVLKIAKAIAFAHERAILHRDLKPDHVLLDRGGEPRVTDFGLAKWLVDPNTITTTGQVIGTPSYMAPEQARGSKADIGPASDVYGLGAILYCLLTGRPPFRAATATATLKQVLDDEPAPPRKLNSEIPVDLETICLHCLEKEPNRRYQSAHELAADLERFLDGEPIHCRRRAWLNSWYRWSRRVERIREAGLVVTVAGTWLILMELMAFCFTILNVEFIIPLPPEPRRQEALMWIGVFWSDGLIVAITGWGIQRRRPTAIAVGALLCLVHLVLISAILVGVVSFDVGGTLPESIHRQLVFVPSLVLALLASASVVLAAVAYSANADRLQQQSDPRSHTRSREFPVTAGYSSAANR